MFRYMQDSGRIRMEIARLGRHQAELKELCQGFEDTMELFRGAIAAAENIGAEF